MTNKIRCPWPKTELDIKYHDQEWGRPQYDSQILFEFLILEGAQAGLSWSTILKRREGYRVAFDNFNPEKIARYTSQKIEKLLLDSRIIRNRLKILSTVNNAKAYLQIPDFSAYFWGFVEGRPIINHWNTHKQIPVSTDLSDKISKDLKKRGFSFVGSTICYAYMQAIGMVDDHLVSCFCKN